MALRQNSTVARRNLLLGLMIAGLAGGAGAQAIRLTEPAPPLLPQRFGQWLEGGSGVPAGAPVISLVNVDKAALEECGPQRSEVANFSRNGRILHVEAIQFGDRTGAYSAFTLVSQASMKAGRDVGSYDAVGDGAVLFTEQSTLVLVTPATAADVAALKPLAELLPKVSGSKGVAPLLPTFVPAKGLVPGSVRYALGPATYQAQGGVLPANSLEWNKSAEAVTAKYNDKRGQETLTLLFYPTPEIAGAVARAIQMGLGGLGPDFATAKVRREGELVLLANGTFSPDVAQRMIENIHLRQQLTFDKDVQPVFHEQVQETYSLLANIAVLSGVLMLAAVLLGLFLGGGRALIRVMRGKSAASEPEFLSLHLNPKNPAPRFRPPDA